MNFHYNEDMGDKQKGMFWVILALYEHSKGGTDFVQALNSMLGHPQLIKLYNKTDSYLAKNVTQLHTAVAAIQSKDLFLDSPRIKAFVEWKAH